MLFTYKTTGKKQSEENRQTENKQIKTDKYKNGLFFL